MAPKLYMTKLSPVVRAVLMCAKTIDLELELIEVDLLKKDHLNPEFVKINPLHTVPTLDDNGLILCDSHAIMCYFVRKYAKDKSLYPEDVEKRALIDQKLYFDCGVLFARHVRISMAVLSGQKTIPEEYLSPQNVEFTRRDKFKAYPVFLCRFALCRSMQMAVLSGQKTIPEEYLAAVQEAYGYLETFLKDQRYVAGDSVSIADLSIINTITNATIFVPLKASNYPKIALWMKRMESLPCYEINQEGAKMYRTLMENILYK